MRITSVLYVRGVLWVVAGTQSWRSSVLVRGLLRNPRTPQSKWWHLDHACLEEDSVPHLAHLPLLFQGGTVVVHSITCIRLS